MENISNRAVLVFTSDLPGQKVRLSVPRARTDKTSPEALASMQAIIAAGAVCTPTGSPAGVYSAAIESTGRVRIV